MTPVRERPPSLRGALLVFLGCALLATGCFKAAPAPVAAPVVDSPDPATATPAAPVQATLLTAAQAEPPANVALPPDLNLVPRDAFLFVSVRVGDAWNSDFLKAMRLFLPGQVLKPLTDFEKTLGLTLNEIERVTLIVPTLDGTPAPLFVATAVKPYDRARVLKALAVEGKDEPAKGRSFYPVTLLPNSVLYLLNDRSVILGPLKEVQGLLDGAAKPAGPGPLTEGLAYATQKHHVVVGVNPTFLRKEVPANLPLEAQSFLPLLAMRSAAVTVDLKDGIRAAIRMTYPNDNAAQAGETAIKDLLDLGRQFLRDFGKNDAQMAEAFKQVDAWLGQLPIQQKGPLVLITPVVKPDEYGIITGLALPVVQRLRGAATRLSNTNNLKELGLAMHHYHDALRRFPPAAIHGKDGKPLLSWRVAVLPYLKGGAELYKEFKLDEPWDSPHNKKLLARMPKVFAHPTATPKEPYSTFYRVFTGPGTVFEGNEGISFAKITDGTSNTLLVVEAAQAVPWTKPDELVYDPAKPLPKLGGHEPGGIQTIFCDGSVRTLRPTLPEKTLRLLITRSDGMPVEIDN